MSFDLPTFLVAATALTGAVWLIDAWFFAPRRKAAAEAVIEAGAGEGKVRREPLIVEYSRSFFPVILIVLLLRSFLVEPFRIPSGSMMPTLLVGDFILVNKFAYGLRLPVTDTKIVPIGEPERGNVVVFRFPQDPSIDYIKRVVGVPGDRVAYRDKVLYVNGIPAEQSPLGIYTGVGSGARNTGSLENNENLAGTEHRVLVHPLAPNFAPGCQVLARGEIEVPDGHYFVMGDNRDNSNDSRCWGLVPEKNLVGKAFAIWLSWDWDRAGWVAWERIGNTIQ